MKRIYFFILLIFSVIQARTQDRIDWDQIKAAAGPGYIPRTVGVDGAWTDSLRFLSGRLSITGGLDLTDVTALSSDSLLVWRGNRVYRRSKYSLLSGANAVYGTGNPQSATYWVNDSTLGFQTWYFDAGMFGTSLSPAYKFDMGATTSGMRIPVGPDAQRPTGAAGVTRYNNTNGNLEFYGAAAWEYPVKSSTASGLFTAASVPYADANGRLTEENTAFFYTATSNSLQIGTPNTSTVTAGLLVTGGSNNPISITATNGRNSTSAVARLRAVNNAGHDVALISYSSTHSTYPGQSGIVASDGHLFLRAGTTADNIYIATNSGNVHVFENTDRVGISELAPQRDLHIGGEVRIADLVTDAPTWIVGADSTDGDITRIRVGSGLSLSGATLTATAASYSGWTLAGDTGSETIGSGNTATFTGGWGIVTAASATDVLTVRADSSEVATQYDLTQSWLGPRLVAGTVNIDVLSATNSDLVIDTLNDVAIRADGQFSFKKLSGSGWFEIQSEGDSLNLIGDGIGIVADSYARLDAPTVQIQNTLFNSTYAIDASLATTALVLPTGPTSGRPVNKPGAVRWNTDTPGIEVGDGSAWNGLVDGAGSSERLAIWSDANTLSSDARLYFTGGSLYVEDGASFSEIADNSLFLRQHVGGAVYNSVYIDYYQSEGYYYDNTGSIMDQGHYIFTPTLALQSQNGISGSRYNKSGTDTPITWNLSGASNDGTNSVGGSLSMWSSRTTSATNFGVTQSGDLLGRVTAGGNYDQTGTSLSWSGKTFSSKIEFRATETYSSTARGSKIVFSTTDNTTTTLDDRLTIDPNGDITAHAYDDTKRDSAAHLMGIQEATGKLVPIAQVNAKYMENTDLTLTAAEIYKFQEVRMYMSTTSGASSQTELTIPDAAAVYLNTKIVITSVDASGTYSNLINTPGATMLDAGVDASSFVLPAGATVVLWGIKTGASTYRWAIQQ